MRKTCPGTLANLASFRNFLVIVTGLCVRGAYQLTMQSELFYG
jgi:hypothetical protein